MAPQPVCDDMSDEDLSPDPPLTHEQAHHASQLSAEQLRAIDLALLARVSTRWRKVALVVGSSMEDVVCAGLHLPDVFFSSRVRALVTSGALESLGDLDYMRFSEVRLSEFASRP